MDGLLQPPSASSGHEQPTTNERVAQRHEWARATGGSCGYAASLGQRKRVAHIPNSSDRKKRRKRLEDSFEGEENRNGRRLYTLISTAPGPSDGVHLSRSSRHL